MWNGNKLQIKYFKQFIHNLIYKSHESYENISSLVNIKSLGDSNK